MAVEPTNENESAAALQDSASEVLLTDADLEAPSKRPQSGVAAASERPLTLPDPTLPSERPRSGLGSPRRDPMCHGSLHHEQF